MKKLFLVALAAVGLASCVQNEELAVAGSTTAIAFGDCTEPLPCLFINLKNIFLGG